MKLLKAVQDALVAEARLTADGSVMLRDGYYLEPHKPRTIDKNAQSWTLMRLMDDEIYAIVWCILSTDPVTGFKRFAFHILTGTESKPMRVEWTVAETTEDAHQELYSWVEKNLSKIVKEEKIGKTVIEAKTLDDGRVLLQRGFFLEPDIQSKRPNSNTWKVRRLMDEDDFIAFAHLFWNPGRPDEYTFFLDWMSASDLRERPRKTVHSQSYKLVPEMFFQWVDNALTQAIKEDVMLSKHLGEDLFADARKARQSKVNDAKPVYMRRLNKDGSESGLRDATTFHNTEEEAKAHHDQLVKNNPRQKIAHHMYSYNGDETFKAKLVGGKLVPLKGGINGTEEELLADATHGFIQMLDDEGSAAGMWMPYEKKVELYKLYRAKHRVKSAGVDTEGLSQSDADAKVDKKVIALGARGWKLFAKEENGDYVDMVFTKAP